MQLVTEKSAPIHSSYWQTHSWDCCSLSWTWGEASWQAGKISQSAGEKSGTARKSASGSFSGGAATSNSICYMIGELGLGWTGAAWRASWCQPHPLSLGGTMLYRLLEAEKPCFWKCLLIPGSGLMLLNLTLRHLLPPAPGQAAKLFQVRLRLLARRDSVVYRTCFLRPACWIIGVGSHGRILITPFSPYTS